MARGGVLRDRAVRHTRDGAFDLMHGANAVVQVTTFMEGPACAALIRAAPITALGGVIDVDGLNQVVSEAEDDILDNGAW